MEEDALNKATRIFTNYLENHKFRKTPERYKILKYIYINTGHFNIDSLYNDIRKNYRISKATVYNTILLLVDCKLVNKLYFSGKANYYEMTLGILPHRHFICIKCGKVIDLYDDTIIKTINKWLEKKKLEYTRHQLYVYGICEKCKQKKI